LEKGEMAAQLGEGQPQVITSPDGKLQTLHHKMSLNRFGHGVVEGALRNISSDSDLSAEVKAEYYDAAGTLIGTEVDILRHLEPGKTGAFEVVYSGLGRADIKYYRIVSLQRI
jgi:hypothetical protein